MLVDYTKYKDFDKLQDIFREVKSLYDIEKDVTDFKIEDWDPEYWKTGRHEKDIETWSYDIYNVYTERKVPDRYKSLVDKIKQLHGICYSAVIVVNPQSVMVEHTDWGYIDGMDDNDPDKTYTILYYLKQPKTTEEFCGMSWGDKKLYLPEDSILCLDGGRVEHSVYNYTDEVRVSFCLSVLESSFDL